MVQAAPRRLTQTLPQSLRGIDVRRDLVTVGTLVVLGAVVVGILGAISGRHHIDSWTAASFVPVLILSAFLIVHDVRQRPYSLQLMHSLFNFAFLGLAPLLQYVLGTFPMERQIPFVIQDGDVMWTNALVLLWVATYTTAYYLRRRRTPAPAGPIGRLMQWPMRPAGIYLAFAAALGALGYFSSIGFFGALTRGEWGKSFFEGRDSTPLMLVTSIFVRGIPVLALAAAVLGWAELPRRQRRGLVIISAVLVVGDWMLNNPLAASRYWTGMVLIGVLIILVLRKHRMGGLFVPALLAGIFLVLSTLDETRYAKSAGEYLETHPLEGATSGERYVGGDFDAYASLLITIRYVDTVGIAWGRQLMGSALFWYPRAVWPDKPIGSGSLVAEYYRMENKNISSPLPAEGAVNFGVAGIVVFALVFGSLLRAADDSYWSRDPRREVRVLDAVYPFWLGLIFFMSRGDLMSSLAYFVGTTVASFPLFWHGRLAVTSAAVDPRMARR